MSILPREHNVFLKRQVLRFHKTKKKEAEKPADSEEYTSSD